MKQRKVENICKDDDKVVFSVRKFIKFLNPLVYKSKHEPLNHVLPFKGVLMRLKLLLKTKKIQEVERVVDQFFQKLQLCRETAVKPHLLCQRCKLPSSVHMLMFTFSLQQ